MLQTAAGCDCFEDLSRCMHSFASFFQQISGPEASESRRAAWEPRLLAFLLLTQERRGMVASVMSLGHPAR